VEQRHALVAELFHTQRVLRGVAINLNQRRRVPHHSYLITNVSSRRHDAVDDLAERPGVGGDLTRMNESHRPQSAGY
jgi:hypothetical protein